MNLKVLFTYGYGKENMTSIADLGYEIYIDSEKTITNNQEYDDVDVLVCYNPFQTLNIHIMKNLKFIQLSSTGVDQIPQNIETGILIANNHGGYSIPIGEWVVLKILEIYKNTKYFYKLQENKKWKLNGNLLELKGKQIAFLGTGTVATESAKRLQGFETNIIGFSKSGKRKDFFNEVYKIEEFENMAALFDVVILTLPHTSETYHFFNEKYMKAMKYASVLINVARGKVLDEKALMNNYEKFLGIALDVFEEEPLEVTSPLWDIPNLLISPHNSWISEMRNTRRFDLIYENLRRFINNENIINEVDVKRGY
ncbi:MAG: dihydrofolate reductase [Clostridiales bacterium]|nr:dihydrofolate reductase [Clostridiales bacterium]